jgi:glyoxylase-like metal-dependent hydrolase (beta-lactamase superfamily II)
MQVAPRINRIGSNSMINAYLVEEGGSVTLVDAGIAGLYGELAGELASMGRTLDDVRALILTHGHGDHLGFAERIRRDRQTRLWVHEADVALARGEVPNPSKGFGPVKVRPLLAFLWFTITHGGLRTKHVAEASVFADGAMLDVPGSPRIIHTPGHTPGSAVLEFASHRALLVGDAFATYAVTTGRSGPQIAPFTADRNRALESLARIQDTPADVLLPGHGEPWSSGTKEAIGRIRDAEAGPANHEEA